MGTPVKVVAKKDIFYENFDKIFRKEKPDKTKLKLIKVSISVETESKTPTQFNIEFKLHDADAIRTLQDKLKELVEEQGEN